MSKSIEQDFRHLAGLDLIQPGETFTRTEAEITDGLFRSVKGEREVVEQVADSYTAAAESAALLLKTADGIAQALRSNDLNSLKIMLAAYPQITDGAWKALSKYVREVAG